MNVERIPLKKSSAIYVNGSNYIIFDVIGFGGSCIAYSAEREQTEYEKTIGMPKAAAVIKEFYPAELSASITRVGNELKISEKEQDIFGILKQRFENGAANQAAFYTEDSSHSLPPARVDTVNNTAYSIVDLTQGIILGNARNGLISISEIFNIMISLCNAVKKIHLIGKIHLDIKPPNIFLFNKEDGESRRIALFDFDTVVSLRDISTAVISFSEGWSPYEQKHNHRNKISFAADIYSIGAVFYWLVSGEKVTDNILNDIKRRNFSFLDRCSVLNNKKSPRESIAQFLSATLKRESKERIQNVEEL